eukprot:TRINITY_DN3804_c0_g1_i1.p3 TRINITY_DN3804_c0_g1~~TRINITY_DN3804_c0_g1_i1.p3  ORF type:complete len:124 (+),score=17.24 TRINITY_DN3804_c0_g1_i1:47-418(+)
MADARGAVRAGCSMSSAVSSLTTGDYGGESSGSGGGDGGGGEGGGGDGGGSGGRGGSGGGGRSVSSTAFPQRQLTRLPPSVLLPPTWPALKLRSSPIRTETGETSTSGFPGRRRRRSLRKRTR